VQEQCQQTVIRAGKIDINRFDISRAYRDNAKMSDRNCREDVSLETKIDLQMFPAGVMQYDLPAEAEQKWAMKNQEKRNARSKRHRRATPKSSVRLRACLTIFTHEGDTLFPRGESANQVG
jgi:hypothetical protein